MESGSDDRYIRHHLGVGNKTHREMEIPEFAKWCAKSLDKDRLLKTFEEKVKEMSSDPMNESLVTKYLKIMESACNGAMKRVTGRPSTKIYNGWWNEKTAKLRRETNKLKRRVWRSRKRIDRYQEALLEYKTSLRSLRKSIAQNKKLIWIDFCRELYGNIWGRLYVAVMKKIKGSGSPPALSMEFAEKVLATLFPEDPNARRLGKIKYSGGEDDYFQGVTPGEIEEVAEKIKANKAPGLDGMPPIAIKLMVRARPDVMAGLVNGSLANGNWPIEWKRTRVVLLKKEGKEQKDPSAYRPICIIDTAGKVLEKIVRERIMEAIGQDGFARNQYGFVKGKNTTQALQEVARIGEEAAKRRKCCVMVTFDVRNAFNTLNWRRILQVMRKRSFPYYLQRIIRSYFLDRNIRYYGAEGVLDREVSMGVPQGSILGPVLWNLVYDDLLKTEMPKGTNIIGYADDVALVATDATLEGLKEKIGSVTHKVKDWLVGAGLSLAIDKTEVIMLNRRRSR